MSNTNSGLVLSMLAAALTLLVPIHPTKAAITAKRIPILPSSAFTSDSGATPARSQADKAVGDTIYLYGGPGSLAGTFQDAAGNPDWQGWTGADRSTQEDRNHWHPSVFNAGNLDTIYTTLQFGRPAAVTDTSAAFGAAVAAIGDINGDGYGDVLVGSAGTVGGAAVYFGGATPDTVVDLYLDPAVAVQSNGNYGSAVAGAGDVNGDGYDDFLIGAPWAYHTGVGSGSVLLFLGGAVPDAIPDLTMTSLDYHFGASVAGLGDINGDSFADFAVGADGSFAIYFGAATEAYLADRQLVSMPGSISRLVVAGAGDLNGDGVPDLAIGLPDALGGRGVISAYAGGATLPLVSLGVLGTNLNYIGLGSALAAAGDFNGDGFADLVVGTKAYSSAIGHVYLVLGAPGLPGGLTFATDINNPAWDQTFGRAVAGVGDLDGDGFDDILVGEPGSASPGRVHLFRGNPTASASIDDLVSLPVGLFGMGATTDGPLDFNGDGLPDLLFGAPPPSWLPGTGQALIQLGTINHAVYCGVEAGEPGYVFSPGYGNNWHSPLAYYWDVADSTAPVALTINGLLNCSLESGYDFLNFQMATAGQVTSLKRYTGVVSGDSFSVSHTAQPADYIRDPYSGQPAVLLYLLLETDISYSDQDGREPSGVGAAQVDNIEILADSVRVSYATFEPVGPGGNPDPRPGAMPDFDSDGWLRAPLPFCGDFAKLITNFQDTDPLRDNFSPQVAFLDDGTPPRNDPAGRSTGGTHASLNYGIPAEVPGQYWGLNNSGGISATDHFPERLNNVVRSPAFLWNDPTTTRDDTYFSGLLRFDIWSDLPLPYIGRSFLFFWELRWTTPTSSWSPWQHSPSYQYGNIPSYLTQDIPIANWIPADAESLQIAIGVEDVNVFGNTGAPAPASLVSPLFDNVMIFKALDTVASDTISPGGGNAYQIGPVGLIFQNVATTGVTTVDTGYNIGTTPTGFRLPTSPPLVYDVQTTALVSGNIQIILPYDEALITVPEQDLVMLHWDNQLAPSAWVDITTSVDTVSNLVYGLASHLSPFTLAVADAAAGINPGPVPRAKSFLALPVPNPLNPRTRISFSLAAGGRVDLGLYDLRGHFVRRLVQDTLASGSHARFWDGRDEAGRAVASGTYFVRLAVDGRVVGPTRKVTLVR